VDVDLAIHLLVLVNAGASSITVVIDFDVVGCGQAVVI
jgi:hypothetical protein